MNWPPADRALQYPDLVHVLSPATPVPTRSPVVYTVHDLWPITTPQWYTMKERWLFRNAIADAARRATVLIANSQRTADQMHDHLGIEISRIRVVHMAVEAQFFAQYEDDQIRAACMAQGVTPRRYLVMIGAVASRKNPLPVVEAMVEIKRSISDLKLLMVGPPGDCYTETIELVRRLGLTDSVRLLGWIPSEQLRLLVAGAACLVHPSLDEGFGMTPLEAMASGVPAIVSDGGALPEVTGDAAVQVSAQSGQGWSNAIIRVVEDPVFRKDLIRRGRAHVIPFTWERVAMDTISVHREALNLGASVRAG